jgi:hypothetical protein
MEKEQVARFLNKLCVLYIKSNDFNSEKYFLRIISVGDESITCLDAKNRLQIFEFSMIGGCSEMTSQQQEKFRYIRTKEYGGN